MRSSVIARTVILSLLAALALAACSNKPVPPCPSVRVDSDTDRFVKFQKNQRDLTEVAYGVELVGYKGQCKFAKKGKGVTAVMDLTFEVVAGPGTQQGDVTIPYFVAIPQFFPKPEGKRIMSFSTKLGKPGTRQTIEEKDVRVYIPLKKDEPGAAYDIYVGIQMNEDDADYNRKRREQQPQFERAVPK